MRTDRIDFISAYCDRWCERCAFTSRCSTFAMEAAIGMCGDVEEGLQLALGGAGMPPASRAPAQPPRGTPREARAEEPPLLRLASAYSMLAHRWLRAEREAWGLSADAIVREAMNVIAWDHVLIRVKLDRALNGRQPCDDGHPIQNDANGSAKLALICIERSEASWRVVAQATGGDLPLMMAGHLAQLRADVEREFPEAHRFVRPGFDEDGTGG
jgi:hypothetical protein